MDRMKKGETGARKGEARKARTLRSEMNDEDPKDGLLPAKARPCLTHLPLLVLEARPRPVGPGAARGAAATGRGEGVPRGAEGRSGERDS